MRKALAIGITLASLPFFATGMAMIIVAERVAPHFPQK